MRGGGSLVIDCMSDYYDVSLKSHREDMLLKSKDYRSIHEKVEAPGVLLRLFKKNDPTLLFISQHRLA